MAEGTYLHSLRQNQGEVKAEFTEKDFFLFYFSPVNFSNGISF